MLDYNFPKIKFCKRGHAIIGDNIKFLHNEGKRWLGCKICTKAIAARSLKSRMPPEDKVRQAHDALLAGKTITQIVDYRFGNNRIIRLELLNTLFRKFPKVGKRFRALSEKNAAARRQEAILSRPIIAAPSIIRAADDIMDVIESAVPLYLPYDHRCDVIQNIWKAVLEGRLKRSEIASRAKEFVRAEYRSNHNRWGDRSLDVPIWVDSSTTLLDTLSTEQALWSPR